MATRRIQASGRQASPQTRQGHAGRWSSRRGLGPGRIPHGSCAWKWFSLGHDLAALAQVGFGWMGTQVAQNVQITLGPGPRRGNSADRLQRRDAAVVNVDGLLAPAAGIDES